jgi:cyanophycinase
MMRIVLAMTCLLLGLGVEPCVGGDMEVSILGLPVPQDPARPGSVMLHGGGRVLDDTFTRFVDLAGGKNAKIILVPSAGFSRTQFADVDQFEAAMRRRYATWVGLAETGRIARVSYLATDDPADADNPEFVRPLAEATGVWFSGGAQQRLNYRYVGPFPKLTRFQAALRDLLVRGGVVGGTSAGMAALPQIMTLRQVRPPDGGPPRALVAHGLGLFDGAIVEQHFDNRRGRLERFTELLRDSDRLDLVSGRQGAGQGMLGLAVETSTALVLQADRLEVLGVNQAHVFLKLPPDQKIAQKTLKAGERMMLKRDAKGYVEVLAAR